jgi:DNA-binding response OmpR family regulator
MKILVVDDELPILESVSYNLRKEGYETLTASDARECLALTRKERPDLIILDVMLPSGSGFDVCRQIRQQSSVPIIMLTARAGEADRVIGLELGADDYVTKPFSMRELMARVKTILRRNAAVDQQVVAVGGLVIDSGKYSLTVDGVAVPMSRKEFDLLYFLATHPGRALTRETLLDRVWGADAYVVDRTVDVHVRWIREKIEKDPARPRRLLTVRGVGYKFAGEESQDPPAGGDAHG